MDSLLDRNVHEKLLRVYRAILSFYSRSDMRNDVKNALRSDDIDFKKHYIRVSGSFGVSGQYAEGFVLNLLMCLLDLDYKPKVISHDWEYGTKEDWEWLDGVC